MAISDRITSIEEHIKESYQELEGIGIDTTEVDKNLENIPKLIDGYWETLPKVTGEGTSITLDNTKEGKMKIGLKGNTSQETAILPSGYTQVDYIESSGTQYIDTGHILNANDVIDITYDYVADGFVFGSRTSNTSNYSGITNESTANFNIRMGNTLVYAYNSRLTGTNSIHIESGNIKINGEVVSTTTYGSNFYSGNFYLFALNQNGTAQLGTYSKNRIRYFKIEGVMELIPCYRNSDNEVGLYDLVNNVFYTNAGTGTFTYGAVVTLPNPDYPQDIHVVSGDNSIKVEGKNLLHLSNTTRTNHNITGTITNDNVLTYSGTVNGAYADATETTRNITLQAGTYYFSIDKTQQCRVVLYISGDVSFNTIIPVGSTSATFTLNEAKTINYRVGLTGMTSGTAYSGTIKMQLEKNTQATTYEAYKGASYPIDLRGTNLFEGELEKGGIEGNAGTNDDRSDLCNIRIRTKEYILIDDTKKILSYNLTNGQCYAYFYDSSKRFLGITSGWGSSPLTFTPISNTKYVRFVWRKSNNATINVNEISSIELRNEAIELCKIGTYQDSIKKSTGKNLFNGETELGAYDNNGNKSFNNNCRRTIDFIEVKPSTTYIFSRNGSTFNCKYFYYDKNKNYISSQVLNSSFTTPDNCYYLNFFSDQLVSDYANLMLNEGTTALPYEPYGTNWYLNKQIGKVVLNGSESGWSYPSANRFNLDGFANNYLKSQDNITYMSNNYIAYKQTGDNSTFNTLTTNTNYGFNLSSTISNFYTIRFKDTRFTSVNDFKAELALHNLTIYYVLATPTYTEITDSTLISQLEALNGSKSYTTQTNISQENNDNASILNASALSE